MTKAMIKGRKPPKEAIVRTLSPKPMESTQEAAKSRQANKLELYPHQSLMPSDRQEVEQYLLNSTVEDIMSLTENDLINLMEAYDNE